MSVQLKPLTATGKFDLSIVPLFFLPKACRGNYDVHGVNTADDLWRAAVHFLNAGFDGVHPRKDHNNNEWTVSVNKSLAGKPFCGGEYRLLVWICSGDLEYYSNELRFRHFASNLPCWFCNASRLSGTNVAITDVSENAAWKATILQPEDDGPPLTNHPIIGLKAFSRYSAPGDLMHSGCLGIVQYFVGSVLHEMIYDHELSVRPQSALAIIWDWIRDEYQRQGITNKLTNLTLDMISSSKKGACLNAKAAESQSLLFALREILVRHGTSSDHRKHRLRACETLCGFYKTVKDAGMFMTEAEATFARKQVEQHLLHYNWLLKNAINRGVLLYPLVTKHHMVWHLADASRFLNPRVFWCYEFEDFIGDVVVSARSCLAGTQMRHIGAKILESYLLVLQVTLSFN